MSRMNLQKSRCRSERIFWPLASAALLLAAMIGPFTAAANETASPNAQSSDPALVGLCTPCHGPHGVSQGPATPTIARLSRNYVIGAMLAYKFPQDLGRADALIEQDPDMEDVVVLARPPGAMNAIAEMLSMEEIKTVATYFSAQDFVAPRQHSDSTQAASGKDIHQRYCEKCHEDGGQNTADDVGLLAGQWKLYLGYLFEDLAAGHRQIPKKMKTKVDAVVADHGDEGIDHLIEYYAGQPPEGDGL